MDTTVPTVGQVVAAVKSTLEGQFRAVNVQGEVTNLSRSGPGHYYFTLSDRDASLSCCLFRIDAMRNPLVKELKDGDKIIVSGGMGVYAKRGTFQLIAKRITAVGKGDLKQRLEKLKQKLSSEGLFDLESKNKIPLFPKRIGLITAEGSAAYHDFINVSSRRTAWLDVLFAPALVQGDAAPKSLRKSLHNLIAYHLDAPESKKLDVIVLTRGGGSIEDLWAFNDEALAWDIHNCPIPVISAVGHEVDFSISDFVADKRCETPSAAAEVLSQSQVELLGKMNSFRKNLSDYAENLKYRSREKLNRISPVENLRKIESLLNSYQRRLEVCKIEGRLAEFTGYHDYLMRLEDCLYRLKSYPEEIKSYRERLERNWQVMRVLDPRNVLGRGYSFVTDENGAVVTDALKFDQYKTNKRLSLHFRDGEREFVKG